MIVQSLIEPTIAVLLKMYHGDENIVYETAGLLDRHQNLTAL